MTALMEIEEQELSEIDLGSQYEMNPCSENGVFRRYHVKNDPVNWIDPFGLKPDWLQVIRGGSEVILGGALFVPALISGGTGIGAPLGIALALGGGAAIGHGVTSIIAGFGGGAKVIAVHPVSIGTYMCTNDLDKAEEYQLYYDMFTGLNRSMNALISSPTTAEQIIDIINLTNTGMDAAAQRQTPLPRSK